MKLFIFEIVIIVIIMIIIIIIIILIIIVIIIIIIYCCCYCLYCIALLYITIPIITIIITIIIIVITSFDIGIISLINRKGQLRVQCEHLMKTNPVSTICSFILSVFSKMFVAKFFIFVKMFGYLYTKS